MTASRRVPGEPVNRAVPVNGQVVTGARPGPGVRGASTETAAAKARSPDAAVESWNAPLWRRRGCVLSESEAAPGSGRGCTVLSRRSR